MFDAKQEYEEEMAHQLQLAKLDGWKLQVWHRVQEIDAMTGFGGFKADFLSRMKGTENE